MESLKLCLSVALCTLFLATPVTSTADNGSTLNVQQQLLVLLEDNSTLQEAGQLLFDQYPTGSTVLQWNKASSDFDRYRGRALDSLGKESLVYVLGFSSKSNGETRLAGFDTEQLSNVLCKLLPNGSSLSRVTMLGCNSTRTTSGYLDSNFLRALITSLNKSCDTETMVSARTVLYEVDSTGEALVGDVTLQGINWNHNRPSVPRELVARIKGGTIVVDNLPVEHYTYPCLECGILSSSGADGITFTVYSDGLLREALVLSPDSLYEMLQNVVESKLKMSPSTANGTKVRKYFIRERVESKEQTCHQRRC